MAIVLQSSDKHRDDQPLCSVCIANYNGEKYLAQCIDSILNQLDFPGSIEIIVHDDASTDGSVAFIQSGYPQIRLLRSTENVGFCVSNNRMVEVARGIFILLLNNDAVLHKDALKTLYSGSQKYGEGIFGLPQYNAESGELIDIGSTFDPFLNPIPNKDINRQDVGMIIGACLWMPKTLWNELGGFPDWFGSLAEDMYICCLARLWGYHVKALPKSGFDHWVGKSLGGGKVLNDGSLSTTLSRRGLSERNKTFVMIISYPASVAVFLIPLHLFLLLIEGSLLSILKLNSRIWKGIYWNCIQQVWRSRQILTKKRTAVQKMRQCSTRDFMQPFTIMPYKISMLLKHGLPKISS